MARKVYLYVNGIRTRPGDSKNWNGRATTFTQVNTQHAAEKIEYYTPALLRPFNQRRRARKLIKVVSYYGEFDKVLVAHSNGADVVLDALRMQPFVVEHLHLISPAVSSDCEKNGLNRLLRTGLVKRVTLWMAGQDRALKWASLSAARHLLGYGALGLKGPKNLAPLEGGRMVIKGEPNFGHSEWFAQEGGENSNFYKTMREVLLF